MATKVGQIALRIYTKSLPIYLLCTSNSSKLDVVAPLVADSHRAYFTHLQHSPPYQAPTLLRHIFNRPGQSQGFV